MERTGTCFRNISYSPLPSQKQFHSSTARFKGFSGPIGSGKSQALCQEAIRASYLNPGRTGLIGAPTYPMLRDATQSALFEVLHSNSIPFSHNKSENVITMEDTGSKVLFRSMDEFERLRGTNLAWFGLDELSYTAEEAWLRLEGRLRDPKANRLCGFAVWTPKGYDWVYRRFIADETGRYGVVLAKPFENRHILDKVPDFYERLRSSYDDSFFRQEVLGEYLNVGGSRVFSSFERTLHLQEVSLDPSLPLLWAVDFNVDPMCSVIAQLYRTQVSVLDEIVLNRATTQQACDEFSKRYPNHPAGVVIYGDASGKNQSTKGSSDYDIIISHFRDRAERMEYRVPQSNPPVRDRITVTNAKLRSASGNVDMLIHPRCRELIQDFEQVTYKADSTEVDKMKDRRRTHLSDALGYLIYQESKKLPKAGERSERILV